MKRCHSCRVLVGACCLSVLAASCGSSSHANEATATSTATATATLAPAATATTPVSMSSIATTKVAPAPTTTPTTASTTVTTTPMPPSSLVLPEPGSSLDETAPLLTDWNLGRTLDLSGSGTVAFGGREIWVLDERDRTFTGGLPDGHIFVVNPATMTQSGTVEHAIGGFPFVADGYLWLINAEFGETVTRVNLDTHEVRRFRTSDGDDPSPEVVVVAGGWVWVGNNQEGTVAKVDPNSLDVVDTIRLTEPGGFGVRGRAATDGNSVWFGISRTGEIVRLDAVTGEVQSRLQLPIVPHEHLPNDLTPEESSPPEVLFFYRDALWVSTLDHVYKIDVSEIGAERIVADLPTGSSSNHFFGIAPNGAFVILSGGPVVLYEVDADTAAVLGRFLVPAPPGAYAQFAVGDDAVYARMPGQLIELTPR